MIETVEKRAEPTPGRERWTLSETTVGFVVHNGDFTIATLDFTRWPPGQAEEYANLIVAALDTAAERERLQLEIEQCHAKSTCCCGDYMKHHSSYSGHNPVSMYDSALSNIEAERDRLRVANAALAGALDAFVKAKASVGANSYDGVDEHTRHLLEHADVLACAALAALDALDRPVKGDGT